MKKIIENIIVLSLVIIGIGMLIARIDYAPLILFLSISISTYLMHKRGLIK